MARRHHYRRRTKEPMELEVTTFLNLMVVLVPFLLITAVFSRITIVELSLPSSTGGQAPEAPVFRVEVIVRDEGLEISNGTSVIAAIPKVDGEYDLPELAEHMIALKRQYSSIETASVLLEPQVPYDYLIQVMDTVRSAEIPVTGEQEFARVALFTNVSIGVAP
ncbi:MAG TPA: biopolymer transporter ExbD [Gammaproteobacteria bacterium]